MEKYFNNRNKNASTINLQVTAAMTNCWFCVAGNGNFINFVHSSGKYSAILAATRHGGETLSLGRTSYTKR